MYMYMYMKICLVVDVLDVITCAKFQNEIFRGYDFTWGRIFHFLMALVDSNPYASK